MICMDGFFFMYVAQLGCVMHQLAIHCSILLILGSEICMYSRNIMYVSTSTSKHIYVVQRLDM